VIERSPRPAEHIPCPVLGSEILRRSAIAISRVCASLQWESWRRSLAAATRRVRRMRDGLGAKHFGTLLKVLHHANDTRRRSAGVGAKIASCSWPAACLNLAASPMDNFPALGPPSLRAPALRRHTALVRALLDELDRIVPSPSASPREDALEQQLIEELSGLACRILECTATMARASETLAAPDSGPQHPQLARARAAESTARSAAPSLKLVRAPGGE
jgi:hypothetical protein